MHTESQGYGDRKTANSFKAAAIHTGDRQQFAQSIVIQQGVLEHLFYLH